MEALAEVEAGDTIVEERMRDILDAMGVDPDDKNFLDTPRRFTEYLGSHFLRFRKEETVLAELRDAVFPSQYQGMIIEKGITATGMCPHHLLPIAYTIAIGYLPNHRTGVLGLSKLTRLARLYACQPLLQEDVTEHIVDTLEEVLQAKGCAVIVSGQHDCMAIRGVRNRADVITSAVRGILREDGTAKQEFLTLLSVPL